MNPQMARPPRPQSPRLQQPIIPDRSLEPESTLATVAIRATGQHPFVYRKMVIGPVGPGIPNPGDMVRVVDRDSKPLGFGLWNPRSQISLRMLSREPEPPGPSFWEQKIDRAVNLRVKMLGLDAQTTAYRVLHAEGDGLTGLIADRFDDVLSLEVFSLGMYQRIGPILELCSSRLGTRHFRVQVDERVALQEDFPGRLLSSPQLPPRVTIGEHGIRYRIHFEEGHKTGFFCDQRDNRRDLAQFCRIERSSMRVATPVDSGSTPSSGGRPSEVTCVDLDEKAVALARENGNANSVRLSVVHADAFGYMRQMAANQKTYGVVVLDPPKLIPDRDEVPSGKRKYFDLNVLGMGLVEPGGLLLTCSCSGLLPAADFQALLRAAARKACRSVQLLALTGASADHPVALDAPEGSYLKAAWLRIGDPVPPADL